MNYSYNPPGPPQNVVAGGGNATAPVRWAPPVSNGGQAIDSYLVGLYDLGTTPATLLNWISVCATCTFTTDPGLVTGHAYVFGVWAHNPSGGYGPGTTSNGFSSAVTDPMVGAGDRDYFRYDTFALSDRTTAKVNLGTGNLEVAANDLVLPMVGGSLPVSRTYNSLSAVAGARVDYSGQYGYLWASDQTPDVRLIPNPDPGTVVLASPSGGTAVFAGTGGATSTAYTTPPGLDSTLVRTAGDGTYTLTVHGSQEKLRFGADGQLLSDADRNANTLSFSYPDGRREATITGTAGTSPGNTVNIAYNGPSGQVSAMSQTADGVTRTLSYTYNANDEISQVIDASGRKVSYLYDASANLTQISVYADAGAVLPAQVTNFAYDTAHRVTSVGRVISGSADAVTRYDYTTPGHTKVTDPDAHPPLDYAIDASGRVSTATDARGGQTATTYTPDFQVNTYASATAPTLPTTTEWANANESLRGVIDPMGAHPRASFANPAGPLQWQPDTATDAMGNQTDLGYSPTGDPLTAKNHATGALTRVTRNADGTVANSTQPNNITDPVNPANQDLTKTSRYGYLNHQLSSITPPAGNSLASQALTYDGAGRLRTATTGRGVTTTYSYDALDRVRTEAFSDATPTITLGYDVLGNLNSRVDASGTTSWLYDEANRLKTKTLPGGAALSYGYDLASNLTSLTDAGGTTAYHYNKANEMDQVTEPVTGRLDVFAYDADHRRTDTWYATTAVLYDGTGNNVVPPASFAAHIRSTYDAAGNLTEIRTTRASSDAAANRLADIAYAYVVPTGSTCAGVTAGMVTAKRQTSTDLLAGTTTSYCYDPAGRLTQAATASGPTYSYGYDADGNRTTDAAGAHTFNTADQLTDVGTSYDADGNLTASVAFPALSYNGVDQTTSATALGQAALPFSYAGRGQGERTSAGSTTAQNGALGVQTETTGGSSTAYVRDPDGTLLVERTPSGDFYYYFDGLGSVIGLVDPAGNQRAAYTYDPYGGHATATALNGSLPPNPWRYASGYLDTTGLYHFGARYYNPSSGRWTQPDPLGGGYAYAGGDPVNNVDPSGLKRLPPAPRNRAELDARCIVGTEGYAAFRSLECDHYREYKVSQDPSYYYTGKPTPEQSDILERNFPEVPARVLGCALAFPTGAAPEVERFCLGRNLRKLPYGN